MIKTHYADKLAGHISRDATAIHAREKAAFKPKAPQKPKGKKRGRRGGNERNVAENSSLRKGIPRAAARRV